MVSDELLSKLRVRADKRVYSELEVPVGEVAGFTGTELFGRLDVIGWWLNSCYLGRSPMAVGGVQWLHFELAVVLIVLEAEFFLDMPGDFRVDGMLGSFSVNRGYAECWYWVVVSSSEPEEGSDGGACENGFGAECIMRVKRRFSCCRRCFETQVCVRYADVRERIVQNVFAGCPKIYWNGVCFGVASVAWSRSAE